MEPFKACLVGALSCSVSGMQTSFVLWLPPSPRALKLVVRLRQVERGSEGLHMRCAGLKVGISLLSIQILLAGSHLQCCLSAREVGKCSPSACPGRRWDGSGQALSTVIFRLWEVYVEQQKACDLCSWMNLDLDTGWTTLGKESISFSLSLFSWEIGAACGVTMRIKWL